MGRLGKRLKKGLKKTSRKVRNTGRKATRTAKDQFKPNKSVAAKLLNKATGKKNASAELVSSATGGVLNKDGTINQAKAGQAVAADPRFQNASMRIRSARQNPLGAVNKAASKAGSIARTSPASQGFFSRVPGETKGGRGSLSDTGKGDAPVMTRKESVAVAADTPRRKRTGIKGFIARLFGIE